MAMVQERCRKVNAIENGDAEHFFDTLDTNHDNKVLIYVLIPIMTIRSMCVRCACVCNISVGD